MKRKITILLLSFCFSSMAQTTVLRHIPDNEPLTAHRYTGNVLGIDLWGYVTGHNIYYDFSWGEQYITYDSATVTAIISHHTGTSTSTTKEAYFIFYDVGGDGLPNNQVGATRTVTHNQLKLDGSPTLTPLFNPVNVGGKFFVTFQLPDYAHDPSQLETDTLALLSTADGFRATSDLSTYGRNTVLVHKITTGTYNTWKDIYTDLDDQLKINLAIYPVVTLKQTSVEENFIEQDGVKFYPLAPNPCEQDYLRLNFQLTHSEELAVQIYNLQGKLVKDEQLGAFTPNVLSTEIFIGDLNAGQYILAFQAGEKVLAQNLIIH